LKRAAPELRADAQPTPAFPGKASTPRYPAKPTQSEACPVSGQFFRTSCSAPRFAGERPERIWPQHAQEQMDFLGAVMRQPAPALFGKFVCA